MYRRNATPHRYTTQLVVDSRPTAAASAQPRAHVRPMARGAAPEAAGLLAAIGSCMRRRKAIKAFANEVSWYPASPCVPDVELCAKSPSASRPCPGLESGGAQPWSAPLVDAGG